MSKVDLDVLKKEEKEITDRQKKPKDEPIDKKEKINRIGSK